MTITEHWHDLVTAALLGTDRRDPPPPVGPIADTVDDALGGSPSARMLTAVAATVVARRAGMRPGPPAASLGAPLPDARPIVSPAATARWLQVVVEWPVLEDEWLSIVARRGQRLAPDVLVAALRRHRRDAVRWTTIADLGGPAAEWLVEHRPDLGRTSRAIVADEQRDLDGLPPLPVAPELLGVLTAGSRPVVRAVGQLFAGGTVTPAHRQVLVNFVARCRPAVLGDLAATLRAASAGPAATLALTLADLAECRAAMLAELEP